MKKFLLILISFIVILHFTGIIDLEKIYKNIKNITFYHKKELDRQEKAQRIDNFFASINAPVTGYGMDFVLISEKYKIDWRLLPAICRQESCGGIYYYNNDPQNVFGYKIEGDIRTIKEGIDLSAKSISGNGRRTYLLYRGKNLRERLAVYSGGENGYADKIFSFMNEIHHE